MIESQASRTAMMVAAYRARASARDNAICEDPWACALAGDEGMQLSERFDAAFPHMELWMAVRTAYLDAHVDHWTALGFKQVILLGAGLDTRAARLASPGVTFYEVDHPATQAYKRERLAALPDYPVDAARYVPCDFETQRFVDQLEHAGFSRAHRALILWEGVVPYLTEPAIRATLDAVATRCHADTVLLFDYIGKRLVEAANLRPQDKATLDVVHDLGEPVRFGTNDPLPLLYAHGFRHVRTITFDQACLSLTGTYDRSRLFRFQHICIASRTPHSIL